MSLLHNFNSSICQNYSVVFQFPRDLQRIKIFEFSVRWSRCKIGTDEECRKANMFILGRNELFLNSSKVLEAAEKFYLGSYIEEKDSIRKINGIEYAFDIPVNKGEDTERSFIRLLD